MFLLEPWDNMGELHLAEKSLDPWDNMGELHLAEKSLQFDNGILINGGGPDAFEELDGSVKHLPSTVGIEPNMFSCASCYWM